MKHVITEKIAIGISACNYGCSVRYNKKGWDLIKHLKREGNDFIWHPVCPEVMSGMGVPRDPIRIVGGNGVDVWNDKAIIKSSSGRDLTEDLKSGALICYETLQRAGVKAFAYMEGSPSCGVYRTTLKNRRLGSHQGYLVHYYWKRAFF